MRRSASTLQYHIARDLAVRDGGVDLAWVIWQRFDEVFAEYDNKFPYAVLKCHAFIPDYSGNAKRLFSEGRGYAVYIRRDIRDVVASLIRMTPNQGIQWDNLPRELKAINNEHAKWVSVNNVLSSIYDDVVNDIDSEVRRIADFIGAPYHDDIADIYSIENQRKRQPDKRQYDLLWKGHVGTGETGQWEHSLNSEQLRVITTISPHLIM